MRRPSLLITFCALLIASPSLVQARAADAVKAAADPAAAAQNFYAHYVALVEAQKDTKGWVAASSLVTPNFKKTYAKVMGSMEVDADPVLMAQYVPEGPFKAAKPEIKGDRASVVLTAGREKHQVTVTLIKIKGSWRIDSVK